MSVLWVVPLVLAGAGALVAARGARLLSAEAGRLRDLSAAISGGRAARAVPASVGGAAAVGTALAIPDRAGASSAGRAPGAGGGSAPDTPTLPR